MKPETSLWALVVDDQPDDMQSTAAMIKDRLPDFRIIEAVNGAEAFQKISKQSFDLVVTALEMPNADGLFLLKAIRELKVSERPKHIVLLADPIPDSDLMRMGNVTCIPKPLTPDRFGQMIVDMFAPKPSSQKVDIRFINPFIDATLKVLEVTAGVQATKESVFLRTSDQISGDISAIVSMNSDLFLGSMAVAFEERCFLAIVEKMLGESFTSITPEIQDAAGELCNQIFGTAKKTLNEEGHSIRPAIPSIITGKNHSIKHIVVGPCIAVRFVTPNGYFVIETVVQQCNGKKS